LLNEYILTLITFVPLAGAVLLALLPAKGKLIQWAALLVTLVTFVLTLHLPAHYDYSAAGFQFESDHLWIASPAIRYHMGVDGLSLWLVVLAGFLAPFGVLTSWSSVRSRTKEFYIIFLLLQTAMFGIFVSLDLFLYYAFWELSLVPTMLLLSIFGRTENKRRTAIKYFLYTFPPSALLLVGMLWLYAKTGTFDFPVLQKLAETHAIGGTSCALFLVSLSFLFAFAVKVPVFPLHGWLSDSISDAPTAVAMVIAGKLGLYSMLRFSLGLFPEQSRHIAPLMVALGAIGIVYGALLALVQTDMRRLAAYSTLGHLSFCVLGIFSFTIASTDGTIYQLLNHGISAGALFILMAILYDRYGTYDMTQYGGLASKLPWVTTMFVLTALSLVGLPILNGFVGEFLILSGSFIVHPAWGTVATLGVILSAAYMLWAVQKTFYGNLSAKCSSVTAKDMNGREHLALWPLAVLMLVMGVASPYWMRAIDMAGTKLAQPAVTTLSANVMGGTR
jgi:NADH-quinone oxidoreductase subunit M